MFLNENIIIVLVLAFSLMSQFILMAPYSYNAYEHSTANQEEVNCGIIR